MKELNLGLKEKSPFKNHGHGPRAGSDKGGGDEGGEFDTTEIGEPAAASQEEKFGHIPYPLNEPGNSRGHRLGTLTLSWCGSHKKNGGCSRAADV